MAWPRLELRIAGLTDVFDNINLVAAGAGISAVPALMREFHKERVVYCRIRGPRELLVAPINMVYRQEEMAPAVVNFLELAKRFGGK